MKVVSIVGARPQFIKCAPISRELRKKHEEILVHTGQHYDHDMSDIFFKELHIPNPDYNLNIGSGSHGKQTGAMLSSIEEVILKEEPDILLVYGDTNSTISGALAATKLHIPIAHVEAGLRSYDRSMPEEINRVLTDHISDMLFCPTETSVNNLAREGIMKNVFLVGDVMIDALNYNINIASRSNIIKKLGLTPNEYILATIHRPVNTDNKINLDNIIQALGQSGSDVLFPVHPRTKKYLNEYGLWKNMPDNIVVSDPLGYLDMLRAMSLAKKIVTDSGGVQKEAYALKVPCITLRDNTEWIETVEYGWNVLVGSDLPRIKSMLNDFVPSIERYRPIFGIGDTSATIVKILDNF